MVIIWCIFAGIYFVYSNFRFKIKYYPNGIVMYYILKKVCPIIEDYTPTQKCVPAKIRHFN